MDTVVQNEALHQEAKEWSPPAVYPGQIVYFKRHPSDPKWVYALVDNVRPATQTISVVVGVTRNPTASNERDNVVHCQDPRLQDPEFSSRHFNDDEAGVWDLAPWDKDLQVRLRTLESQFLKRKS